MGVLVNNCVAGGTVTRKWNAFMVKGRRRRRMLTSFASGSEGSRAKLIEHYF